VSGVPWRASREASKSSTEFAAVVHWSFLGRMARKKLH
jgi:hypothetical protein